MWARLAQITGPSSDLEKRAPISAQEDFFLFLGGWAGLGQAIWS